MWINTYVYICMHGFSVSDGAAVCFVCAYLQILHICLWMSCAHCICVNTCILTHIHWHVFECVPSASLLLVQKK